MAAIAAQGAARADIDAGSTLLASNLGGGNSTVFNGGTLQLDASKTYGRDFTFKDVTGNTIDLLGSTSTFSGKLTGDGGITIGDTKGGGILTLTDSNNNYKGFTTINSGATLALYDSDTGSDSNTTSGSIQHSAQLVNNGTFDISGTASGTTIIALSGSGKVILGAETLTIYNYDSDNEKTYSDPTTFSGVISGSGSLTLTATTLTLSGANTYTGYTSVSSGTLALSGVGSIAKSSNVAVYGALDVTNANSVSLKSLSGSGSVLLGANTLRLTAAGGTFSGIISGTGGLTLESGTEYLTGANTFTGSVTVNGGLLEVGSPSITYNVTNNAKFAFYSSSAIAMSGVISGTGEVQNLAAGVTTITTAQTYTGATTISYGTLKLSGNGTIATSSSVVANGVFDISSTTGASITSLAGTGTVTLGSQDLTITNGSGTFSGLISGSGDLILAGGAQILSGASTFTGTTTVNTGTLILRAGGSLRSAVINNAVVDISTGATTTGSASIGSLSGAGGVTLGANTLVLTAAANTYAGTMSGTGGLWLSSGTEILSGTNTYTGTTTVAGGTLSLSSTGSLAAASALSINGTLDVSAASGTAISFASLAGTGTVALGAHTLNLTAAAGAFSGVLQGTAGLLVSGGTEILAGSNTYTGGTTVASGATLQIGSGTTGGSIVGNVVNNGTLAFDRSNSLVFSGTISGSGGINQFGAGTTILTAKNTYTGGTTISFGTLQIGNGSASGSILGNVVDNGTLAFARSDGTVLSAVVSGTGNLSVVSGTSTLTAVNSYTGATTVASGATLILTGAGNIATSRNVADNGTFDVSAATGASIKSVSGSGTVILGANALTITEATGTFSGVMSGSGALTIGGGTQMLSSTNTYTGLTTVNGGTLAVTGSIAASQGVAVNSGGVLSGTGTVSALTVASGGTVKPTAGGTLTVNGGVTFASGSSYVVDVTSSSATTLKASGAASLAGTLNVASQDGTYRLGEKLTVLTAGSGVSGTFALGTVASTGAEFKSALTYDANHVYLEIDLSKLSPLLPTSATVNQKAAVGGIDRSIAAGQKPSLSFQDLGNDSSAGLAADADQLAGEIGGDLPLATRSLVAPFLDAIFDHMSTSARESEAWLSAFDGANITAADLATGAHRFKSSMAGIVAGAQWMPWSNVTLGAALSAGLSDFHLSDNLGTGHASSLQGALYAHVQLSPHIYNSFAAAVTLADIKTERALTVSGTDELMGKLTAKAFAGRYEAGASLGQLTPYIAVQGVFTSLPGYSETASSGANTFALTYASQTSNDARVELGFHHAIDIEATPRWILTPDWTMHFTDKLAWAHDFAGGSGASAAFTSLPSSGFSVNGVKTGRDFALASVGADFLFDNGLRITSRLDTAFSQRSQNFTGFAGLGYKW
jgi:autotransporter-associated beta strand protein